MGDSKRPSNDAIRSGTVSGAACRSPLANPWRAQGVIDPDLCLAGLTLVHRSAQSFQKLSAVEGLLEDGGNLRGRIW